jgi:predicted tellurium resistance membrane protein TerC
LREHAMPQIFTVENAIALLTLTVLEIVLGIDNIIFISILADKLPKDQQNRGRQAGLMLAMLTRILLLLSLSWIIRLENPLFSIFTINITGRDLILLAGGIFLIAKSTMEIHDKLEGKTEEHTGSTKKAVTLTSVVLQIGLLDIVFSLDSVITAVGMAKEILIMILAVIIAVIIMLFASGSISKFVNGHPTIKILALSFLLLIGTSLLVEGLHQEIPKGYIYFAMAFSVFVEMLNLRVRGKSEPIALHQAYEAAAPAKIQPAKAGPAKKRK